MMIARGTGLALAVFSACASVAHADSPSTQRHARHPHNAVAPIGLLAVGDICLSGGVERAAVRSGRSYPFAAMRRTLRNADIAFGNLECTLSARGRRVPKQYSFRASPQWAARLADAGFDVLSLANNHTMDYDRIALRDTADCLRRVGIMPVGAGRNQSEAHALRTVTVRGIRVGFLAYLGMFPPLLPILPQEPGVAMGYPADVRRRVAAARRLADVIVVSMHAGIEGATRPSPRQREIAHAAVDAGADLVIGHHPHVVQPVEHYRGKPVFYSLGNFVFNPSPSYLRRPDGQWCAMAVAKLHRNGAVAAKLVPLRIVDRQPQPVPQRPVEKTTGTSKRG